MIKSAPYYWVVCDRCGISAQEGSDWAAWADLETCEIEPTESDWNVEGGNHVCWECIPPEPDDEATP